MGCNHNWENIKEKSFWSGKLFSFHKCTKCGKKEECVFGIEFSRGDSDCICEVCYTYKDYDVANKEINKIVFRD